jgi:hypothetical protein
MIQNLVDSQGKAQARFLAVIEGLNEAQARFLAVIEGLKENLGERDRMIQNLVDSYGKAQDRFLAVIEGLKENLVEKDTLILHLTDAVIKIKQDKPCLTRPLKGIKIEKTPQEVILIAWGQDNDSPLDKELQSILPSLEDQDEVIATKYLRCFWAALRAQDRELAALFLALRRYTLKSPYSKEKFEYAVSLGFWKCPEDIAAMWAARLALGGNEAEWLKTVVAKAIKIK